VGEAADGDEALRLISSLQPDLAVLDVRMPGLEGPAVRRALAREGVRTRAVFLSAHTRSGGELRARLGPGAAGYLSKEAGPDEIADAVVAAARGLKHVGHQARPGSPADPDPAGPARPAL